MIANKKISEDAGVNVLINNILNELCPFLEEQAKEIADLTAIGKALGARKNINGLLKMILSVAQKITKADGGTLYLIDHKSQNLVFHIIHNTSLNIKKTKETIDLPGVPLFNDNNMPNLSNVSSYVFHTRETVNIKDVYKTKMFKFEGTKKFDTLLHYKSRSMIVIPMKNHEDDIIGILQLINSKDQLTNKTISFTKDNQEKAASLAGQTSVFLTQQMLILGMEELFEAFIKALAVSIDEKSKHTSGHIQRVTKLCLMIAQKINQDNAKFKTISLSPDQINELRIAALMHDTGKIITPDHIVDKSSRLETIFDRIELLKTRWELFKTNQKLLAAQKKLALFDQTTKQKEIAQINCICNEKIDILEKEFETLSHINSTKEALNPEHIDRLKEINKKSILISGKQIPCLNKNEFENLCILRGTLTSEEKDIINNHANLTKKILCALPWPKKLANIPYIAGAHHEKLNGSGYPFQLKKENLTIQARILAIADIFEALSAQDRPYRKPMMLSQAVKTLEQMGKDELLDKDIIELFFKSKSHLNYAKKYLSPSQIDL